MIPCIIVFIHHLSMPLRRCFFSLLSCSATRLRECIQCCMRRTAILKNDSTAEKRREEETFALASIALYCFVETNLNCGVCVEGLSACLLFLALYTQHPHPTLWYLIADKTVVQCCWQSRTTAMQNANGNIIIMSKQSHLLPKWPFENWPHLVCP